ncbi:hypothetical protein [Bacillus sp. SA1-12]|uniref:hypothetical protein n=1 Tax=Bacillus sp. SA1-12 TaxID=1455638 RepID=UPI0012E062F8|nr:hypothetical protein [Bacillus sp. SA1-12]
MNLNIRKKMWCQFYRFGTITYFMNLVKMIIVHVYSIMYPFILWLIIYDITGKGKVPLRNVQSNRMIELIA